MEPDPARLGALRRIAEVSAVRVWRRIGGEGSRFRHGLDLDDLVASAWEAILRALPRHRGPRDHFLWEHARGGALDALRRADPLGLRDRDRRRAAGESTAITDSLDALSPWLLYDRSEAEADQRTEVEARDAARMVREALAALDGPDRQLLLRVYRDELHLRDVARELGVSPTVAALRHRKALQRMEHALVALHGRDVLQET